MAGAPATVGRVAACAVARLEFNSPRRRTLAMDIEQGATLLAATSDHLDKTAWPMRPGRITPTWLVK